MKERTEPVWKDYLWSLGIAFGIAVMFSLFMPSGGRTPIPLGMRVMIIFVSGMFFGNAFFGIGYILPRIRFRSFLLTGLTRSLVTSATMLIGLLVLFPSFIGAFSSPPTAPWRPEVWSAFAKLFPVSFVAELWLLGLGLSFLINAIHQIDRKLGKGVLWNWLTGKYHTPREEERIFMFLDLKNSTTLAEKLGNLRFSQLVRDFFQDLTGPIVKTKGEVSHYIGDEAVLTWKPKNGLEKANCVRAFYLMEQAIEKRAAYYQKEFGIVPEFKAGVHLGLVVATEVGDVKSEIVYHGDVLNTTARITGLCSEMGSDLLISGELNARLSLPETVVAKSLGLKLLKGKEHEVEIVAISEASPAVATAKHEPDKVTV